MVPYLKQPFYFQKPRNKIISNLTLTTTQLQPTTLRGFPSLSILQRPTHSPSFLLSSTCTEHDTTLELAMSGTPGSSPEAAVLSEALGNGWLLSSQASAEGAKVSSSYSLSLPGVTGMLPLPSTPSNNCISHYTGHQNSLQLCKITSPHPLPFTSTGFVLWKNGNHTELQQSAAKASSA